MAQEQFSTLDFYGKLDYMIGVCGEAYRGLKRIANESAAWDYIEKTCILLETEFITFNDDEEFNDSANFSADFRSFRNNIAGVLEITPLIIKGSANYSYLVQMLATLINVIENNFPRNVRLARMFKTLVNNKEELARRINADEEEVGRVLFQMLNNIDEVEAIIKTENQQKKVL